MRCIFIAVLFVLSGCKKNQQQPAANDAPVGQSGPEHLTGQGTESQETTNSTTAPGSSAGEGAAASGENATKSSSNTEIASTGHEEVETATSMETVRRELAKRSAQSEFVIPPMEPEKSGPMNAGADVPVDLQNGAEKIMEEMVRTRQWRETQLAETTCPAKKERLGIEIRRINACIALIQKEQRDGALSLDDRASVLWNCAEAATTFDEHGRGDEDMIDLDEWTLDVAGMSALMI